MPDRITVSVLQLRLEAIVQEMGEAMLRTAYSQILNSSRDFSTAVCDGEGRLAAQAEHVPIHVGAMPWAVQSLREFFTGRIHPGDMFLLNDPYHGGNHLPDLTVLLPVFVEDRLVFWSINRAHQSDIGGATHGAYNPSATEIWQEGIRITPLKLYDRGALRDDVLQMLAANVRHSRDFLGDLRAMIGSARFGERRLLRLVDEYGVETLTAAVGEILDSAERQARACVQTWQDGVYQGEAILDDDGHGITDIHIRARVTKHGDSLTIDLTDSHPQVIGFVNSPYPNTVSAIHMAFATYVGPTLSAYLNRLAERLRSAGYQGDVLIMQSHGGVAPIADAARLAAGAILSGPAGGIAASRYCARLLGEGNLISFDMGGTSTDISVLEAGEPLLTGDKSVGGLKVALPSIDIHTLGAGGGSIAHVDLGGILHVRPESAGADPGPACYGKSGMGATVTDANLVLGYLDPGNFLGGRTPLDRPAALAAVAQIARQLKIAPVEAAEGIQRVVNTNMAEGIRLVSARRGVDPRRFALLAFGGAAALHITEVARMLEIARVVVPRVAAVLSAWGMLATDLRCELVRTHVGEVQKVGSTELRRLFTDMEANGRARLATAFSGPVSVRRAADLRYGEQIFEITVQLEGVEINAPDLIAQVVERFHRRHEELYPYSAPDQEVVLVNVRLAVVGELPMLPAEPILEASGSVAPQGSRRIYLGTWLDVPVYQWHALLPEHAVQGPAIFESATTTVLLRHGDRTLVTPHGWLDIRLG